MLTGAKLERRIRERLRQAVLKIAEQRGKDRQKLEAAARRAAVTKEFAAQNRNAVRSRRDRLASVNHRRRESRGLSTHSAGGAQGAHRSFSTRRVSSSGTEAAGIGKKKAAGSTYREQGTTARPLAFLTAQVPSTARGLEIPSARRASGSHASGTRRWNASVQCIRSGRSEAVGKSPLPQESLQREALRRDSGITHDEKRWGWGPALEEHADQEAEAAEEEKSSERGDGGGGGYDGGSGVASAQKRSSLEERFLSIQALLKRSQLNFSAMRERCARTSEVIDDLKAAHLAIRLQPTGGKRAPSAPGQDGRVEDMRWWQDTVSSRTAIPPSAPAVLQQMESAHSVQPASFRSPAAQPCHLTALSRGLLSSVGPATQGSGSTSDKVSSSRVVSSTSTPLTHRGEDPRPFRDNGIAHDEEPWGWGPTRGGHADQEAEAAEEEKSSERDDGGGVAVVPCSQCVDPSTSRGPEIPPARRASGSHARGTRRWNTSVQCIRSGRCDAVSKFPLPQESLQRETLRRDSGIAHDEKRWEWGPAWEGYADQEAKAAVEEKSSVRGDSGGGSGVGGGVTSVQKRSSLEERDLSILASLKKSQLTVSAMRERCARTSEVIDDLEAAHPAIRLQPTEEKGAPSTPHQDGKVEETRWWQDTVSSRTAIPSSALAVLQQMESANSVQSVSLRSPAAQPCHLTALSRGLISSVGPATRGSGSTSPKREGSAASRKGPYNQYQDTGVCGEAASLSGLSRNVESGATRWQTNERIICYYST